MNKFYNETFLNLETVIKEIESKFDSSLQRIEAVIIFITQCLAEVKEYVKKMVQ